MNVYDSTGMTVTQEVYDGYVRSVGRLTEQAEQLRAELDAIKRTREQEREYDQVCYENERLRSEILKARRTGSVPEAFWLPK